MARRMWLVVKPTKHSELCDVLWECNWVELGNCFKGGLEGSEVYGLYYHKTPALNVAKSLLAVRDGTLPASAIQGG